MSSDRPSEGLEAVKEEARSQLLKGLSPEEIARNSPLTLPQLRGMLGSLVRQGLLPGKKNRASKTPDRGLEDPGEDPLPGERDILESILKDAGVKKKQAVLKLVDSRGYDVESIYRALGSVGAGRSIKRTVIDLWSTSQNEAVPGYIEDEIETSASRERERGRGQYVTLEQLEDRDRKRNEKARLTRVEEKLDRLLGGGGLGGGLTGQGRYRESRVPVDADGNPTSPQSAVSVRYERVPIAEGGDVQLLRREISDLKEKMYSDQIQGLSNQVSELSEKVGQTGSDVGAIVSGVKDVLNTWSTSEGGPIVKAASPLADAFGKKVLANYNAMSPMPEDMRTPTEPTPPRLIERLRQEGLVSTFKKREEGRT